MIDQPTTRIVAIDGARVRSLAEAHDYLARGLGLPPHYGRNLDALYDCLTTDVAGPLVIEWHATLATRRAIGPPFDRLRTAMEEAARTRADLAVAFL
ncbi:MAG: barstar family protein [Alphaproteobacteria bacterium]